MFIMQNCQYIHIMYRVLTKVYGESHYDSYIYGYEKINKINIFLILQIV